MKVNIADLHPTQLYLSEKKLLVDYRWASQGLSDFIGR